MAISIGTYFQGFQKIVLRLSETSSVIVWIEKGKLACCDSSREKNEIPIPSDFVPVKGLEDFFHRISFLKNHIWIKEDSKEIFLEIEDGCFANLTDAYSNVGSYIFLKHIIEEMEKEFEVCPVFKESFANREGALMKLGLEKLSKFYKDLTNEIILEKIQNSSREIMS